MVEIIYYEIVIRGYFLNQKYYSNYLIRESKKAELKFVTNSEFFSRCKDVLIEEIEKFQLFERTQVLNNDQIVHSKIFIPDYKNLQEIKIMYCTINDLNDMLKVVNNLLEEQKTLTKNYNKNWFQVALHFANGKIYELYDEGNNFSEIAGILFPNKVKGHRPYISSSYNGTNNDKNIFRQKNKMKEVISFLNDNSMSIHQIFKDKYEYLKKDKS